MKINYMYTQSQNSIPIIYSNIVESGVKHHKPKTKPKVKFKTVYCTFYIHIIIVWSFTPFEMTTILF